MEINLHLIVSFSLTLFVLALSSIHDIKKREVPNTITYSFIILGFVFNIIISSIFFDYHFIINSFMGFLVYGVIGYVLFILGLWGGGDLKIVAGMGAMIGVDVFALIEKIFTIDLSNVVVSIFDLSINIPFVILFFLISFFAGGIIGLLYSVVIAIKKRKKFIKKFSIVTRKFKAHYVSLSFITIMAILYFINPMLKLVALLLGLIILSIYVIIFVKIVEEIGFKKNIKPSKLTEGDWLIEDIEINGKVVVNKSNDGISIEEIKKLIKLENQGSVSKVLVKEGMAFLPSLLIGFIASGVIYIFL